MQRRPLLACVLLLPLAGADAWAQTTPLRVGAASSLVDALPELLRTFQAARPGITVQGSTASSGALLEQLAGGTAMDVLLSDDADTVNRGIERRLLRADSARAFAGNALVLVVPAASSLPLRRLADLALPEVQRIAMGRTASVPAGRSARQAIDAARLWPSVQRKVVWADSVREVLALVLRGDVDAGFVYASDALAAGSRVRVVETLAGTAPIRLTAAIASASTLAAPAGEFMQFLRSEAARAVLVRWGFSTL